MCTWEAVFLYGLTFPESLCWIIADRSAVLTLLH
jgi:hypothetical protein